jgi:uncharacterized phage infection (PIP) family protein YhgE
MADPIDALSKGQAEILQRLSALHAKLDEGQTLTRTRLDQLDEGQTLTRTGLDQLDAGQTLMRTRLDQLDAGQTLMRTRLDQLDAGHGKVRAEIIDRIDRLQETVELVREDARVNWATADTAMNRARTSRDEIDGLMAMIAAMERRHQTLSAIADGLRNNGARKPNAP